MAQKTHQGQTPTASGTDEKRRVVVHALSMALGTFSSRVLGLLRDMALGALFSRTITDAWTAAFRLPNLFRRLLGEGSLSVSFIPVFVEARTLDPEIDGKTSVQAQNLVNSLYTVLLLILTVLTAVGIIWARDLLPLVLDENYVMAGEKYELTVRMAQIMFGFIFLMSNYAFFMGILNAMGSYALPAMAPCLFNIAMLVSTLIPADWIGVEGDSLAWGVLVGGVLQTAILIPALRKRGYFPRIAFDFKNADMRRVLRNMLPGMLGTGLVQLTTLVNLRFASSLPEGAISYIYFADRILELPLSLISVSLGAALLPTLSKMWSEGRPDQMRDTGNYYLRLNTFVSLPAAIGLYVLAGPIVRVLFERGQFSMEDTAYTAQILQVYSLILVVSSIVRVLVPSFYAIKNTWVPAVISAVCLVVHILIAESLMNQYGVAGLAMSTLVSASLNGFLLFICYRGFIGPMGLGRILKSFALFLFAGALMGGSLYVHGPLLTFFGTSVIAHVMALGITITLGIVVYGVVSSMLKLEEFVVTFGMITNKVRRRFFKA